MHIHMTMKNCVEVILRLLAELGPPHSNVVPTISDAWIYRDRQPLIKVITEGGSGFTCRRPSSSLALRPRARKTLAFVHQTAAAACLAHRRPLRRDNPRRRDGPVMAIRFGAAALSAVTSQRFSSGALPTSGRGPIVRAIAIGAKSP
jgi:hypothetical protein